MAMKKKLPPWLKEEDEEEMPMMKKTEMPYGKKAPVKKKPVKKKSRGK